jgi:hypothetical protein
LSNLVNLEQLDFGGDKSQKNQFGLTGPIPQWVGELPKLKSVNLAINKFTG